VQLSTKLLILVISVFSMIMISTYSISFDTVLAQNGNTLGQEGDGNDASQSEENSQSTD
jgi:hypothetical protein